MANTDLIQARANIFKLIKPFDVLSNCPTMNEVNEDYFQIGIVTSEHLRISPNLGITLYNKLKAEYILANYNRNALPDATTTTDGIDYKELYNQIYLAHCWWSFVESLLNIAIKISNAGIMQNQTDYSENGGQSAYELVINRYRTIAENYTEKLIEYVCELKKTDNVVNQEAKKEGIFTTGFYFPDNNILKY